MSPQRQLFGKGAVRICPVRLPEELISLIDGDIERDDTVENRSEWLRVAALEKLAKRRP